MEIYPNRVTEVLTIPSVADILTESGVRKALNISMSISVMRSYADLELLYSRWSVETHTSIAT